MGAAATLLTSSGDGCDCPNCPVSQFRNARICLASQRMGDVRRQVGDCRNCWKIHFCSASSRSLASSCWSNERISSFCLLNGELFRDNLKIPPHNYRRLPLDQAETMFGDGHYAIATL